MVKASFWMLVGIFLFTFTAALAKIMASEGFGVWEIVFWRSIVGCLFCAAVMRRKGISLKTRYPVRYVVRCTVGTVSIALSVYTLTVMPIATAQTLTNTGPLWFCVFLAIAALFTAYRLDKAVLLAVLAGFGGVLLILRPDVSQGITMTAAVAGVLSGFTSGGADFMIRHLTHKGEPGERIVFYIMLAGSVTGFLLAFGDGWHDVTPFSILQTALYALAIVLSCIMGDMVISSVKRSLGSKSWESEFYIGRGIIERLAPLTFAAPVFYHLTLIFQNFAHFPSIN